MADLQLLRLFLPKEKTWRWIALVLALILNVFAGEGEASFFVGAGNDCFHTYSYPFDAGAILIQFNPPRPAPQSMGPYYPLRMGSFWTYRRADGSLYTVTVLPESFFINRVFTRAIADSEGFIQYVTNDNNGIRIHRQYHAPTGNFINFDPPLKLFDAAQYLGDGVASSGTAVTNIGNFPYTSFFKFAAFEESASPLRTYDTIRQEGHLDLCGVNISYTVNFARGVGIVKGLQTSDANSEAIELIATNVKTPLDFDGDGASDISIYRAGVWSVKLSSDNTIENLGVGGPSWKPVPADYDGDGITDTAIYSNGTWIIIRSSDSQPVVTPLGGANFIPVPADYDGDGKADVAVYSDGAWSILRSSDGVNTVISHGGPGWHPVPADYDGDGKADVAVYINGAWAIKYSSNNETTLVGHGGPSWTPVIADYDGDGKADVAVYANGAWSIIRSSDNGIWIVGYGGASWMPVPADYDGDGKADVAVYNPSGAWSIKQSSNSSINVVGHGGGPTDVPLN